MKKKVLILGPIGDVGGRDVEVNIIARSLEETYAVRIFSTIYITEKSSALTGLKHASFSSLQRELFASNSLVNFFSVLKSAFQGKKQEPYFYLKNRFSRAIIDFRTEELTILKREIENADIVLACVQLTTTYLAEAAEFAAGKEIPLVVRTTGTIGEIAPKYFGFLKKITHFVHHSQANAENLNRQIELPYSVIDQCALTEDRLLAISIAARDEITFGYIGRFSPEKGVLPTVRFFSDHPQYKFVIAGDGPQKNDVLALVENASNITYIGQLEAEEIDLFFKEIDCLIIPSLEESGPLVGLEAMAAGKIIISTRVGAMPGRLVHTGNDFWLDNGDELSLKARIDDVISLSASERSAISSAMRTKYLTDYTKKSIGKQYLELVKTFVCETRRQSANRDAAPEV